MKELILAALLLAGSFLAPVAAQENPVAKADAVDPFYRNLYEDGKNAFERGAVQEAVEDFEIAFFGYLDDLPRLLECYMYIAVGNYDLKDFDKCKAALEEIRRLDLETHMATAGPSETLLKRFREVQGKFQTAPMAADGGTAAAATEAPVEIPAVKVEVRTGSDPVPPAVDPAAGTTAVPEAGNKTGPEPVPAGKDPKSATPAVEDAPLPNPEDIKPLAPETTPNLEIQAPATAPPPIDTTPMAADGGTAATATEAPVEVPAAKVRAGDLIPLGDADVPPREIRTAKPVYPSTAMNLRREGSIIINVLISETGEVIQTAVIGGDKGSMGFDKAAENAVRKWKFSPAEKDGVPVRVWKSVTIGFKLKK